MPVSSTYIALGGVFALGLVREAKNHQKTKLVQRSLMKQVITAWLITVPCTAVFAAMFFYIADYIF
jgi:PiT family inorganic phosphate transporter